MIDSIHDLSNVSLFINELGTRGISDIMMVRKPSSTGTISVESINNDVSLL
jgi:hypothetical protein